MKDFIGQELFEGDIVAALYSDNETPSLFEVSSFTPKKVRVLSLSGGEETLKYPKNMLKVDPAVVDKLIHEPPKDALGVDLFVGDFVYGSDGAYIDPIIFEIEEFIPRQAKLKKVLGPSPVHDSTRFTSDLIKVDPRLVTMGILKKKSE